MNCIHIGKEEIKLFTDDIVLQLENPNEPTKKKKKPTGINKFSKTEGYKTNE